MSLLQPVKEIHYRSLLYLYKQGKRYLYRHRGTKSSHPSDLLVLNEYHALVLPFRVPRIQYSEFIVGSPNKNAKLSVVERSMNRGDRPVLGR